MRVMNTDPEDLRRYLLGQLAEEEAERMEARLLEDDEVSELAEIVEEELLVEHFQGKLPEGRDLVDRLRASAAGRLRVELAQALAQAMPSKGRPSHPYRRVLLPAAIAAALVGVVFGIRVLTHQAPPPGQTIIASTQVELPPAVLTLALSGPRSGGGAIPQLDLAPEKTRVELRLKNEETYPSYQVSLTREDGSQVPHDWKVAPGFLVVLVRAADLPAGIYGVKATGLPRQGETELLGEVLFKVVRRSKSQ